MSFHQRSSIEMFPEPVIAVVDVTITPYQPGRVECFATFWFAKSYNPSCQQTIYPGELVQVVGRDNITLLVIPISP